MKSTKKMLEDRAKAIQELREILKDWKIFINMTHVSRSWMMRRMKVYDSTMRNITDLVSTAIAWSQNHQGIKVDGCGMDMTFHLAYVLTHELYTREEIANDSAKYNLTGNWSGCLNFRVI